MELAPIGIGTYNRINHLKQTIESLKKNTLAKKSKLYIFSDAPKKGDEEIVKKVRDYIHTIDSFENVSIIQRQKNMKQANNHNGMKYLLKTYGKTIFMEDDNIVSLNFLEYMNNALEFFAKNKKIIAICGYNVPAKFPDNYKHDYFLSKYFNGWGFATWKDRRIVDFLESNGEYKEIETDKNLYQKFKKIHPNLIPNLKLMEEGKLKAGEYKITFNLIKNDKYVVKPIVSFVNNNGHDNSGVHCGKTNKYDNPTLNEHSINFNYNIEYDSDVDLVWRRYLDKKTISLEAIISKIKRLF